MGILCWGTYEFSSYLVNILSDLFSLDITAHELHKYMWYIKKDVKRTEADQLSYPLHIILRYELEKLIINENLDINTLPKLWEEKSKEYNIVAREGCLQDIHWYMGNMGYFPSYLTGLLFAYQLFNSYKNIAGDIGDRNFNKITGYLGTKVHTLGHIYDFNDLIGKKLDISPYITNI